MGVLSLPDGTLGPRAAFDRWGEAAFRHYWRAPLTRRRLEAAGVPFCAVPDEAQFARIAPMTKDELRALTADEFARDFVLAAPGEVATAWRSGGVTGRPLFYPRARADFGVLVESFARCLDMVGAGPGDVLHNSFPLGSHPLGHMFCYAAQALGVGCVPAGSGANTPTETQVELLLAVRPSVFGGLASYLAHLGHVAEAAGRDPRAAGVRVIMNSGEALTPAKRARIEAMWGARLLNAYGMSECSMMGAECEARDGFHVWTDMFHLEILEPGTWAPVPEGEVGMVVVTPLHSCGATPFLRWASGDMGSLAAAGSCPCRGRYGVFPRLRLAGRASGFSKVKGVNIDHQEMEDALLRVDGLADYAVWFEEVAGQDRLRIEVEAAAGAAAVGAAVADVVRRAFEARPVVELVERGTIARRVEADVKQVRVRDVRE